MSDIVPNTTRSELVAVEDLDLGQRRLMRDQTDQALVQVAIAKAISNDPTGLVLRDALPTTDYGLVGGASATGEQYIIAAAGVAGVDQNYINARQLSTVQCAAFWGLAHAVAPSNLSTVAFTFGPTAAQVKLKVQIEQLLSRLVPQGYFSTPIIYVAQDTFSVVVRPFAAFGANTERLILLSRIVDQFGNVISAHNFA